MIEAELLRPFAPKQVHFSAQPGRFDSVPNRDVKLFEVDWLANEIVRAAPQRRDGFVNQHIGGDHDRHGVWLPLANLAQHLET